jgi:hypothetical protein
MKTKTKLIWLLFSIGLIFSNQAVFAQDEKIAMVTSTPQSSYTLSTLPFSSYDYNAFNQNSDKSLRTKEFYLRRSNNQKNAGWILLGTGSAMAVVGICGGVKYATESMGEMLIAWDLQASEKASSKADIYGAIFLTGLAVNLISIPFFISASRNKKMASSLSLSNQTIYFPQNRSYCQNAAPALTLRINF